MGAQNIYFEASGAFTGEMSAEMAKSVGCTHVLIGHSERRELFGETDEMTRLKTRKTLDCGMTAVLCIGETKEEYERGEAKKVCNRQLSAALSGVEADEMSKVVCTSKLTNTTYTEDKGSYTYTYSKCPLITSYISKKKNANKDDLSDLFFFI